MSSGFFILPVLAAPFVGSFLATVAWRLPRGISALTGRSVCPACGELIAPASLVPVLSWLCQRGRCRHCKTKIAVSYPIIELAALAVALWAIYTVPGWQGWVTCGLGWCLLTLSVIDLRHQVLPDILTLPLGMGGIATAWAVSPAMLADSASGAVIGFVAAWSLAGLYRRIRGRTGLGFGDVKLIGAAGAWVGVSGLSGVIFIAAATGLAFAAASVLRGRRLAADTSIPFGPFLALGLWITWLYGPIGFGAGLLGAAG